MKIKFAYFSSCPGWHTFLFACLILLSCLNILVLGINFPQVSLFALLLHSIFDSFHIYVYTILSLASKLFKKAFSLMFFIFYSGFDSSERIWSGFDMGSCAGFNIYDLHCSLCSFHTEYLLLQTFKTCIFFLKHSLLSFLL